MTAPKRDDARKRDERIVSELSIGRVEPAEGHDERRERRVAMVEREIREAIAVAAKSR